MSLDRDRLILAVGAMLACSGTPVCPVSFRVTVLLVPGRRDGTAASGRGAEFPDPGEHDGQQVVSGWQPQGQAPLMADQTGGDAEQFVTQSGGVRAACSSIPVSAWSRVERFPASSAAHIHTVFTA